MELYLIHTPYHLMLSILNGALRSNSLIIMLDMTGTLGWYGSQEVASKLDNKMIYFNLGRRKIYDKFVDKNYFLSKVLKLGIVSAVREQVAKGKVDKIYAFNDSFYEVQGILHSFKGTRVSYIEDGSAPYNAHRVNYRIPCWLARIIFAFKFDPVRVLGTSNYIDDCVFTRPNLARGEHQDWPITLLEVDVAGKSKADIDRFLGLYDLKELRSKVKNERVSLYLFPPMDDEKLLRFYRKSWSSDNGLKMIKKHPLVQVEFRNKDGFIEVGSSVPAEALILGLDEVSAVYGYPSTTLFFSKIVRPDLESYCAPSTLYNHEDFFCKSMEKAGIVVL